MMPNPSDAQLVLAAIKSLRASGFQVVVTNLVVRALKSKGIKHLERSQVDEILSKRFRLVRRRGYPTSYDAPDELPESR